MRELRPYLYQGDISDLNVLRDPDVRKKYGITLAVNVSSTPFVPRGLPTVYVPMYDSERVEDNDWVRLVALLQFVVGEVHLGGKVLVVCNAGISRSITFAGMLISVIERVPMDDALVQEIRMPVDPPLEELWRDARTAIRMWWVP